MNEKQIEEMKQAVGVMAETALILYRAALGAGATTNEAIKIMQAYIGALLYNKPEQPAEDE